MRYFDSRDHAARRAPRDGLGRPAARPSRPCASTASSIGTAASCRTRRSRRCSTTIPARNSLVFAVHIWNPHGSEPDTIWQVTNRQKDIQYSSRAVSHIARQKQIHRLRHVIAELVGRLPEAEREHADVRELAGLRLPDPHARGPPAGPVARRRGPHQGHRLQPGGHPPAAARPATPTPAGCWSWPPGRASSTRSRASSCTRPAPARS